MRPADYKRQKRPIACVGTRRRSKSCYAGPLTQSRTQGDAEHCGHGAVNGSSLLAPIRPLIHVRTHRNVPWVKRKASKSLNKSTQRVFISHQMTVVVGLASPTETFRNAHHRLLPLERMMVACTCFLTALISPRRT